MFKRLSLLFFLVFTSLGLYADPRLEELKGLHGLMKPKYRDKASMVWGFGDLYTGTLEGIRLYGNYGPYNPEFPCYHPAGSALRETDSPQDWVAALIQFLYPSPGLTQLVEATRPSDRASKLTLAELGGIIEVLNTEELSEGNKAFLAGKLLNVLRGGQIENKIQKTLKGNKKASERELMEKQGLEVVNNKKYEADRDTTLVNLILNAALQTAANPIPYPENVVQNALWALAWKKASNKSELLELYAAMPKLLENPIATDKDKNFIAPQGFDEKYTFQNYLDAK